MSVFYNAFRAGWINFADMEKFRIIPPATVLAPYVRHYWLLESDDVTHAQRIIPTGHVELVFHRGCPLERNGQVVSRTSVAGQANSYADLRLTGTVSMIVVVFRPFGAKAFFDVPLCELAGLVVSAEELNAPELKELEDRLCYTSDDAGCIRMIEVFLMARLRCFTDYHYKRMVAAVRAIDSSTGELSVSQLAETVCLSNKQLLRVFSGYVGSSPKEFMRVVRFHRALFTLQHHPGMSFTRVACECGYYDQAHMIRDFKEFSGYTPGEYVAVCAPYSDYFS